MDFAGVKFFVTVAQTLNFRFAAERLYVSQSALSRKINALERELGVRLFERSTRSVVLTAAGKACLENAIHILNEVNSMTIQAVEAQQGEVCSLRVGYYERGNTIYLTDTISNWKRQYPQIATCVIKCTAAGYRDALLKGGVDVLMVLKPCISDMVGIRMVTVIEETPGILLPKNHRFAGRKKIALAELKNEKFIMHSRQRSEHMYDSLIKLCQRCGFTPNVVFTEDDDYTASMHTILSDCVCLHPTDGSVYNNDNRAYLNGHRIPIADKHEGFERVIAWRSDNTNPCIGPFCEMLAKVVQAKLKKVDRI